MEKDNNKLKEFWNNCFKGLETSKIDETWITDPKFNSIIDEYIKKDSKVLDFGCGSGWASFEISLKKEYSQIIGVDQSANAVSFAQTVTALSNIPNMMFIAGENVLDNFVDYFQFVITINTLDVVPEDVCNSLLKSIKKSMKKDGTLFVGINPEYPDELMTGPIGMTLLNGYWYKEGILRGIKRSKDEWIKYLSNFFTVKESFDFKLVEEDKYPRIGFVLTNK